MLKSLDENHFYLNDDLVDLVQIYYQMQTAARSGANTHSLSFNFGYLGTVAKELLDDRSWTRRHEETSEKNVLHSLQRLRELGVKC